MSALADCHLLCVVGDKPSRPMATASNEEEGADGQATPVVAAEDRELNDAVEDDDGATVGGTPTTEVDPSAAKQYRYKLGEAIAFGDGFVHATETGTAPHKLAFLCFTFGHRQCTEAQWHSAEAYIAEQGPIYQDPWGRLHIAA